MVRDQRDPEKLGIMLLNGKQLYPTLSLSQVADKINDNTLLVPAYNPQPVDHSAEYQAELQLRSAEGDKYARSLLESGERIDDGD